ncbi:MAG: 6-phosphogluconolactonase [Nitrospira sp.]|nr:6-phosphogluconolactonase [Nitrospira sp.]
MHRPCDLAAEPLIAAMSATPDIRIAREGSEWAHEAAAFVHAVSGKAIAARGRFLLALSGGSTPKILYQTLASPEWKERFNWSHIFFLFGDERCVPPHHPQSNFAMAQSALFQPLGIHPDHVYRMNGELPDPLAAAQDYEQTLRQLTQCVAPDMPQLDLILLGLGEDGHIASLFPGTSALRDSARAVTVSQAPTGISTRLTLTLDVINRATVVLFLVSGMGKASIVRAILEPRNEADRIFPASRVAPAEGRLIWMLDRSAAAQLISRH